MTPWEQETERAIAVLGADGLAEINAKMIASLRASLAAGIPDVAAFRHALILAGNYPRKLQLDAAIGRAVQRAAGLEPMQDEEQSRIRRVAMANQ